MLISHVTGAPLAVLSGLPAALSTRQHAGLDQLRMRPCMCCGKQIYSASSSSESGHLPTGPLRSAEALPRLDLGVQLGDDAVLGDLAGLLDLELLVHL